MIMDYPVRFISLIVVLSLILFSIGCISSERDPKTIPQYHPSEVTTFPAEIQTSVTSTPTTRMRTPVSTPSAIEMTKPQEKKISSISDEALNARIHDCKNKLTQLKDTDKADTIVNPKGQISKELGCLIDSNTGETFYVKGDYWSINSGIFSQQMKKDHNYVIIHSHPTMRISYGDSTLINLNSFSIGDLDAASDMTNEGYHVLTVIAISDMDYEIYPKVRDGWKSNETIYNTINKIEKDLDTKFSNFDPYFNKTFYNVDNLMPILARELNYTYVINHVPLT